MSIFNIIAIILVAAAIASYINYRFIKLPATIGLMVIGLFMSLAMVTLNFLGMDIQEPAEKFLEQVDFG
ncbi:MAG: sodium:proton antiporter, partial [candidate division Zixibacteria bacterium]|nr:sodium:proton antiporter [candidate division Zixibacteria bacterium]